MYKHKIMKLYHTFLFMFVANFVFMFYIMSLLSTSSFIYITNSTGKLYMALCMASFMNVMEVIMHNMQYGSTNYSYLVLFGSLTLLFAYMYRSRKFIDDKQYLKEMIEHHSMALFTSQDILTKTNDYSVTKLAKNIIQTQQDEINEMQEILKKE